MTWRNLRNKPKGYARKNLKPRGVPQWCTKKMLLPEYKLGVNSEHVDLVVTVLQLIRVLEEKNVRRFYKKELKTFGDQPTDIVLEQGEVFIGWLIPAGGRNYKWFIQQPLAGVEVDYPNRIGALGARVWMGHHARLYGYIMRRRDLVPFIPGLDC